MTKDYKYTDLTGMDFDMYTMELDRYLRNNPEKKNNQKT